MDLAPQVGAVIDTLAAKMILLKDPAHHVWEVMVRQSLIEGYAGLGIGIVGLLCLVAAIVPTRNAWRDNYNGEWAVGGILLLLGGFAATIYGLSMLPHILNPEYYAIMRLKP